MNHPARGSYEQSLVEAAVARRERLYGRPKMHAVSVPPLLPVFEAPKSPKRKRSKVPHIARTDRPFASIAREIIAQEMRAANVGPGDFFRRTRQKHVTRAKHLAVYRIKLHTSLTYPQIAKALGYADHTSVMFAFRKIKAEVDRAERMAKNLADLEWLASGVASSDEIIAKGYQTEVPVKEIARLTGKTVGAVVGRASRLGLSSPVFADPKEYGRRLSEGQRASWAQRKEREAVGA